MFRWRRSGLNNLESDREMIVEASPNQGSPMILVQSDLTYPKAFISRFGRKQKVRKMTWEERMDAKSLKQLLCKKCVKCLGIQAKFLEEKGKCRLCHSGKEDRVYEVPWTRVMRVMKSEFGKNLECNVFSWQIKNRRKTRHKKFCKG